MKTTLYVASLIMVNMIHVVQPCLPALLFVIFVISVVYGFEMKRSS